MNQELSQQSAVEPVVFRENCTAGVTKVTLNRPAQYNALSEDLLSALEDVLNDIGSDTSIRVVILGGAGKAFCAGHDLKEMRDRPEKVYYQDLFRRCSQVMMTMVQLPQPVITQVHGMATAAGCQLVANSDLAVASTAARFAVSGINLGLFCSTPSVPLSRNVSRKRAFEMLMTGRFIYADRALRTGLVSDVVPDDQLEATAQELIDDMLKTSPIGLRLTKETMREGIAATSLESSLAIEDRNQMLAAQGPYLKEGMAAFFEGRDPVYEDM